MKTNEKLMPWDESKPKWSISIKDGDNWEEITNTKCKGNGCKKVSIDEAVDMAKVLQENKMLLDNSVYFKLEIKKLKNEMEKETDRLLGVVRVHSKVVDELKVDRNKLNDKIDKKNLLFVEIAKNNKEISESFDRLKETLDSNDAYVKVQFEETQKLKKSNKIKDIGLYTIAIINIIAIIYNLM